MPDVVDTETTKITNMHNLRSRSPTLLQQKFWRLNVSEPGLKLQTKRGEVTFVTEIFEPRTFSARVDEAVAIYALTAPLHDAAT